LTDRPSGTVADVPELLEVERYRRLAEAGLDRFIAEVTVDDPHCLTAPATPAVLRAVLVGRRFLAARRRGKLLLLDTADVTLGVRFGMTGTLVVDDRPGVDDLLYAPGLDARWIRWRLRFADGGEMALHDPRRLARVVLGPQEGVLGPDALTVTVGQLRAALAARGPGPPLKARLLDQSRVAGIGNLLADEILWRAGLAPGRPCATLTDAELRRLQRHLRTTLEELALRGGSHTGDLMAERHVGGRCPRDGAELARGTFGGRTTWWCPAHQR
jgi:formamidopyrimidine-DNA glycosylase